VRFRWTDGKDCAETLVFRVAEAGVVQLARGRDLNEPIDTVRKEWPEVTKAQSSVLALGAISVILTLGFAMVLNNASQSGKDATIETLKTQMEGFKAERDDLAKKLTSVENAQADEAQAEALSQAAEDRDDLRRQLDSSKKEVSELRDQLNKTTIHTQLP
jgi:uncharacterized protein HemX